MTGSALIDFLIAVVGLCIIVGLIFLALEKISPDAWFKQIGRYAVGGAALLAFLVAIKGVLFGGGGGLTADPIAVLECAIGIVVLVVVVMIIYMAVDKFAPPELAPTVKYVIGALALIVILILAEKALFGGGLGLRNLNLGTQQRHSELYRQQNVADGQIEPLQPYPPRPPDLCRPC